jgi:hypothetical protein
MPDGGCWAGRGAGSSLLCPALKQKACHVHAPPPPPHAVIRRRQGQTLRLLACALPGWRRRGARTLNCLDPHQHSESSPSVHGITRLRWRIASARCSMPFDITHHALACARHPTQPLTALRVTWMTPASAAWAHRVPIGTKALRQHAHRHGSQSAGNDGAPMVAHHQSVHASDRRPACTSSGMQGAARPLACMLLKHESMSSPSP